MTTVTAPADPRSHAGAADTARPTSTPTLAFRDVAKVFDTGTRALEDVSIDVRPGEFVSVVGPSGCGKSTLLRLAAGLDAATEGEIDVRADTTSFVFQEATLLEWRSAQRNVELVGELAGVAKAERRRRAAEVLDLVGLSGFEDQHPRALSGGMRMRVSIARALVAEPQLALFDEQLYELTAARSGVRHYRMLMNELEKLLRLADPHKQTRAASALHQVAERVHQRSLVIVFSDMPDDPEQNDALLEALQHLRYNKHEVLLFHVVDGSRELDFDFENRPYEFVDMETQETLKLNPSDIKEEYIKRMTAYRTRLANQCLQYHIDMVTCDMREPVEQVLHRYLIKRNKMM